MSKIKFYIDRIKNCEKRRYAVAYFNYRRGFFHEPNTEDFKLGAMATQAVRMQIDALME